MNLIEQLQELINSIGHNTSMGECYMRGSSIEGIKEAIVARTIDQLAFENDLFYCHEEETKYFFQELKGQVHNELRYRYEFSLKNKKTIFKKLVGECVIKELEYYIQDRKQTFFDLGKLLELMVQNGFKIEEKEYIKIRTRYIEYEPKRYRNNSFRTVQNFKKWLNAYIPCSIDNIKVKKQKDKYIVTSNYLISIPYTPVSIKGFDVELHRIDTEFHSWDKVYSICNYKEKKLYERVYSEIERLKKFLEKKESLIDQKA